MVTDVTDATVERARAPISYPLRAAVTLLLLAAYVFGRRLALPDVDRDGLLEIHLGLELSGVLMLGMNPLISGFLLVELFSLMTSPGRRLRRLGTAGRATLNRAALITSLLLAAVQAAGITLTLERMSSQSGLPIVANPGFGFKLVTVATLTATTAALFALGQAISAYGIGNGFALLVLTRGVLSIWTGGRASLRTISDSSSWQGIILLLVVGVALLIVRFFRTAENAWLPAFPQGLVPAQVAVAFLPLTWLAIASLGHLPRDGQPQLAAPLMALVLIPLLSWLTFHLFSSRARLQANLTDPDDFLDDLAAALRRRTIAATTLLALGTAAFLAWRNYRPNVLSYTLDFAEVVFLAAIVLDLWDQYRFQRRVGATARLVQLDNVHFSYRLEERLQEAGVAALARGHQFRSLSFFFGALFKIDVLVDAAQLDRAREVLSEVETAREVRAF
jgi:hypothetical protein